MESCFCCFTVKVLKDFGVMTVARKRNRLDLLKAMPTGRPTPLTNAAIPPVINVDVIRPASMMPVIVLNRFIFLAILSRASISSSKYASVSVNFLKRYVCDSCSSCGAVGFKSGKIVLFHCGICSFFM